MARIYDYPRARYTQTPADNGDAGRRCAHCAGDASRWAKMWTGIGWLCGACSNRRTVAMNAHPAGKGRGI